MPRIPFLLLQTTMSDMSDFTCYSEDISLWEPVTKLMGVT